MKLVQGALKPVGYEISSRFRRHVMVQTFSTNSPGGISIFGDGSSGSVESTDEFERRIFGDSTTDNSNPFFEKLDNLQKARGRYGLNSEFNKDNMEGFDGLDNTFTTLTDGMEDELKKSATDFEFTEEVFEDDYTFRPDMNFKPGMTYEPKDLNLRKPGAWRPSKREEFEVTSEEVLRKADFRNVRFLANFITEAGIIIKRSQTKISAKAQRKVAREIKTARAFGLMPFTSMGSKAFVFGRTMQDLDQDYEYDSFDSRGGGPGQDPLEG